MYSSIVPIKVSGLYIYIYIYIIGRKLNHGQSVVINLFRCRI